MVYNEMLANRINKILQGQDSLTQAKMFGGIGYLVAGNMACGVNKDDLIVRVGPEGYDAALGEKNTKVFDMTGRPMKGWVVVTPDGHSSDQALRAWVKRGIDYASSLPPK
jgi:TfoX/Sxy family transcriptional regulator of competence genes